MTGGHSPPLIISSDRPVTQVLSKAHPGCANGVAERFIRTLEEEFFSLHGFESLEEARYELGQLIKCYNHGWLLERHGNRTPVQPPQAAHLSYKAA